MKAVRDAGKGLIDADLGGGVIKQRIARRGGGKRGGYRTVLPASRAAASRRAGSLPLFGFSKSARANIDDDEPSRSASSTHCALDVVPGCLLTRRKSEPEALDFMIEDDELTEVSYGEDE